MWFTNYTMKGIKGDKEVKEERRVPYYILRKCDRTHSSSIRSKGAYEKRVYTGKMARNTLGC
jgi:hypothetical protein